MSANFDFQKLQVDERIHSALEEGRTNRLSRRGAARKKSRSLGMKAALLLGAAGILALLLLSACTLVAAVPLEVIGDPAEVPSNPANVMSMAERIDFKDRLWEASLARTESLGELGSRSPEITRGDEIRLWTAILSEKHKASSSQNENVAGSNWTMAERIRFQDRLDAHP